jgi:hypothetical protein
LTVLLARLEELLRRERAAVAAFDVAALEAIGAEKLELAARVAVAGDAVGGAALLRVRALAEANRALLASSVEALTELLAPRSDAGTYDARARMRRQPRSLATRRA